MKPPSGQESKHAGFDAAVKRREDDHLNRWPFAQEIYGIATTGPADWSVRVGIYGEWGTGKSSVLEFIALMAEKQGHTLVKFNPWQYATKDQLWREFVSEVYNQPIFSSMERAGWVRVKNKSRWVLEQAKRAQEGAKAVNEHAGKAMSAGLELTKSWFTFSGADLKGLRTKLGEKRVIVLIDDLDRTSAELVPEILFALKELMNTPQFSFISAFDPAIVGEVLARNHPGFGDGLKFLEKIIDYPRWLPPAPAAGLLRLALTDAKKYCAYVPETALREVIPSLPPNPRAVRQFTRLLAFLGPQISRHYDHELRWPIILAADALKVCHPRLARDLLADEKFLENIREYSFGAERREEGKPDKRAILAKHVKDTASAAGVKLNTAQEKEVLGLLEKIFSAGNVLYWVDEDKISYQLTIAEAPNAVTWKEYDQFFAQWKTSPSRKPAEAWIAAQGAFANRLPVEVQREIFRAAVQRYAATLDSAETILTDSEKTAVMQELDQLISLLECLVFDLGQLDQAEKNLNDEELELLFRQFTGFTNSLNAVHMQFQKRNESVLFRLVKEWTGDVTPLVRTLKPYGFFPGGPFDREETHTLRQNLCKTLLPGLASQVIDRFREPGFTKDLYSQENEMYAVRGIIFDLGGPMWVDLKKNTFAVFKEATSNSVVQENAFDLLRFFDHKLSKEQGSIDALHVKDLLSAKGIAASLWAAAIATPLSAAATSHLNQMMPRFKAAGADFTLPPWWEQNLKIMAAATEAAKTKAGVIGSASNAPTTNPDGTIPSDTISKSDSYHSPP